MGTKHLSRDILRLLISYIHCPATILRYTGACKDLRKYFRDHHVIKFKKGKIEWKNLSLSIINQVFYNKRRWWPNGQLKWEDNFVNNKREGIQQGWYESGQLYCKENYVCDKKEGIQRYWYPSYHLRRELFFVNGVRVS